MSEEARARRNWARTEREQAEAPLAELVAAGPVVPGTPLRLYYLAAARELVGRLALQETGGAQHLIFFRRGVPVAAWSSVPGLGLLAWLQAQGTIDAAAARRAADAGGDPVAALFSLGILDPGAAFQHLVQHGRAVLDRALVAADGRFAWHEGVAAPQGAFPLGEKWALLCEVGRRMPMDEVGRRLGARIDCPVMRAGDGLVPVEALKLNTHEMRAVASFDGTRSLVQIAAAHPAESDGIYRTGLFLAELGLASFARAAQERPANAPLPGVAARVLQSPAPAQAPPNGAHQQGGPAVQQTAGPGTRHTAGPSAQQAAGPGVRHTAGPSVQQTTGPAMRHTAGPGVRQTAGPGMRHTAGPGMRQTAGPGMRHTAGPSKRSAQTPGPAIQAPTDAAGLARQLKEMTSRNHFELLGLPRNATPAEIKSAYFVRARAYHPDLATSGDPEIKRLREAITARLNEAWSVLSDDVRRRDYLSELETGYGKKVDVANVFAAEELFRQAQIRLRARAYAEALADFEQAIALHSEEGEYYAWRGWARFLTATDKRASRKEGMADVDRALALNPRCAVAWLFAARMANQTGDVAAAIQYYRRCLAMDGANIEAHREMRLLESRMNR